MLVAFVFYQFQQNLALTATLPYAISQIKRVQPGSFLGKKVTVEGYLFSTDNEEFFLIQNFDLLLINAPIPEELYFPVTGLDADTARDLLGSFVRIKGTVIERETRLIFEKDPVDDIFVVDRVLLLRTAWLTQTVRVNVSVLLPLLFNDDYAVLISGGINSANTRMRYWNDIKRMYSILVNNYSYNPERIIVIYKDGIGEDSSVPVDYSATVANVTEVFQELATNITRRSESLFIYTTNHGGGFHPNDPYNHYMYGLDDNDGDEPEASYSEQTYGRDFNFDGDTLDNRAAVDEVLNLYFNEKMRDDDLANLLDDINTDEIIIVMEQCFSGGFVHDLSGTNRTILTAASEEEFSWAADTEGNYDEFVVHFMDAVGFIDATADTDNDKKIDMVEAFNFASQQDNQNETPLYDDNGDQTGHAANIPSGSDGTFGANAFLWT